MEAIQEIATLSSRTATVTIEDVEEIELKEIIIEKVDDKEQLNNEEAEEVTEQKENIQKDSTEQINIDAKEQIEQPNEKGHMSPESQNEVIVTEPRSNNLQEQDIQNQMAAELTQQRTEVDFEPGHQGLMRHMQMMEECDLYQRRRKKIGQYLVSNSLVHLLVIFIHVFNFMLIFGKTSTNKTVKLEYFFKFFSIWVTILQIIYSALRIFCNLVNLYFLKDKLLSFEKSLLYINELVFGTLVWPFTMTMGLIFWPIYWYDRELIFPSYLDVIGGQVTHHILHTFTIMVALWELLSFRREYYMAGFNLAIALVLILAYTLEFYDVFFTDKIWLYPIVRMYYDYWGTVYAGIPLHIISTLLFYGMFYVQWLPQRWIPGPTEKQMMRLIKIRMNFRGPDVTVPLYCCQLKIYEH